MKILTNFVINLCPFHFSWWTSVLTFFHNIDKRLQRLLLTFYFTIVPSKRSGIGSSSASPSTRPSWCPTTSPSRTRPRRTWDSWLWTRSWTSYSSLTSSSTFTRPMSARPARSSPTRRSSGSTTSSPGSSSIFYHAFPTMSSMRSTMMKM